MSRVDRKPTLNFPHTVTGGNGWVLLAVLEWLRKLKSPSCFITRIEYSPRDTLLSGMAGYLNSGPGMDGNVCTGTVYVARGIRGRRAGSAREGALPTSRI